MSLIEFCFSNNLWLDSTPRIAGIGSKGTDVRTGTADSDQEVGSGGGDD